MSSYVDKFIKQHKEYFQRNKIVINNNPWNQTKVTEDKIQELFDRIAELKKKNTKSSEKEIKSLQTEIFKTKETASKRKSTLFAEETELTSSILGRLSAFIKETEKSGDRNLNKVQKFIDSTVAIIDIHLDKCDSYLNYSMDDLVDSEEDSTEELELRSEEIKFQDGVFTKKIKIEDTLNSLNITNSIDNVTIEFFKGQKASLPMMHVLPHYDDDIRTLTEKLVLPEEVTDKTFHIHQDPNKIPKWNRHKHYWEQSQEVLDYWYNEWLKITKGFTVDGYFFHPWLYYHLNFFKTKIPQKEGGDDIVNPYLRDNEWFIAEQLKAVTLEDGYYTKEGLLIYGSRRIAKSTTMASICEWRSLVVSNVSTAITSGSDGDLDELTNKIKTAMRVKEPAFKLYIHKQEWAGGSVEIGLKSDPSTLIEHSRHTIKNLSGGAKTSTQKGAGGAPSVYLIEEIGKFAWEKSYLAAVPSYQTEFGFKTIVIAVGCVCAGTKVFTENGSVVNIEDLTQNQGIIGYDGNSASIEPITYLKEPHKKECVRITTKGGYTLECSTDHPILSSTKKERYLKNPKVTFKDAKSLSVGDFIYKSEKVDIFGSNREEDARLIGLLVGDGYYGRNTPSVSVGDDEIYDFITSKYKCSTKKEFKNKQGGHFRELIISDKVPLLDRLGMSGQTKYDKQIPRVIFESDKETVQEFLAGYFDADGNVYYNEKKKIVRVVLTSICKHLLDDVSILLHKLGIQSTIGKEARNIVPTEGYEGQKSHIYRLYINKVKDVIAFEKQIKLLCKHKTESLKKVYDREYGHSSEFLKKGRFEQDQGNKKGDYFLNKEVYDLAQFRITNIEYIGEKEVYNLTAGNTHTYLANGFITHNTGGEASLSGDSMRILANPKLSKFREMDWEMLEKTLPEGFTPTWKKRVFGTFMPGQMGYKFGFKRIERKFGEFLGIKSKFLDKITIHQTDWETNTKIILDDREAVKKDPLKLQQETVQYPIDPEECFLSADKNPFKYEQARKQKEFLEESGLWDRRREVILTGSGKLKAELSNQDLAPFPHPGGIVKAPLLIFEDIPEQTPVDNLYVASFDDVKQDDSDTDSLISFQVWKMDTFGDEWGDNLVLSWACRPESRREMYETWLLIQKTYNAKAFPENEDMGYKTFLEGKHLDGQWLLEAVDFTASMNITNNGKRKYGWTPRQSKKVLLGMFIEFCNEVIEVEQEDGTVKTMYGVQKIQDIGLLDEIINYKEDGNFDRISAALGAVGWMHYLKKNWILPKQRRASNEETKKKQVNKNSLYTKSRAGSLYRKSLNK